MAADFDAGYAQAIKDARVLIGLTDALSPFDAKTLARAMALARKKAIKDVVGMETQIADALVDSFEDTPEIQVGAYAIAEVVLALIESRFSAPSPGPEEEGEET